MLVGDDGRVRVGDFGLVRHGVGADVPLAMSAAGAAPDLTATGAVMGTPAYMAPEQFTGAPTDARTDQFAFCAALWEALYARRAFAGNTLAELMAHVTAGRKTPPPAGSRVPVWLRRVLERGLSRAPAERWPSTEALLAALQADPTRRRRVLAGVAVLGGSLGLWSAGQHHREQQQIAACVAEGELIAGDWNDEARAALHAGFAASGSVNAGAAAGRISPTFDAHAAAWRHARSEACLDARVRGVWDEDTLDRAAWCLDEQRMTFAALLAELRQPSRAAVQEAVVAAAALPRVDPCRDARRLAGQPPLPRDRDAVRDILQTLARAGARQSAGDYPAGLAAAREALGAARAIAWPPLLAAANLRLGGLLMLVDEFPASEAALERAYFDAARSGALDLAATAAVQLVHNTGSLQARFDEALQWAEHADVALTQLGAGEDDLDRASALMGQAMVHDSRGAYAEARPLAERGLAIHERVLGPEHPTVATSLIMLARLHHSLGQYPEANALATRALAIRERSLGVDHPLVAETMVNLANLRAATGAYAEARPLSVRALVNHERVHGPDHMEVGRALNSLAFIDFSTGAHAEARAAYQRSLAIHEKWLGREHRDVATVVNNLAAVHAARGEYTEARALHERALAVWERTLGSEHAGVGAALNNLAGVDLAVGDLAQAEARSRRAVAIHEKAVGPEHPAVASALLNLAHARRLAGAAGEARPLYERARAILGRTLGPDHPNLAVALTGLARVALAEHRPAEALPLAERAVQLREAGSVPSDKLAESRLVLALALRAADADDARVRALATSARDALHGAHGRARELAEAEALLADAATRPDHKVR